MENDSKYGHVFDNPVAEIDMQYLIDRQTETGEPIVLSEPKNVTPETKKILEKLNNDLLSKGAKVVVVVDANNSTED